MLRCAVDVRSSSIRMALWAFWGNNEPPARLEARVLPRSTSRVLETLEHWQHWYHLHSHPARLIVGCAQDPWPRELIAALEGAGYTLQWIEDGATLSDGVELLKFLQMSPQFMRATLMAHWPTGCVRNHMDGTVFEVQYAVLRVQLMQLEYDLFAEGRLQCPGHLQHTCPNCEFLMDFASPVAEVSTTFMDDIPF